MRCWLGAVSRAHVKLGVELGIAQIGHGKRGGLARMGMGDGLVYYSPRETLDSDRPVRAFTAICRVSDGEIWQADEGDFTPWRRRVDYDRAAADVPIAELADQLDLTRGPNWGYQLRRALVELSARDFEIIRTAMGAAL